MITVYIYTSKTYSSTTTYMDRGDLHEAPVSVTSHKGGGIFKFNGTKEEFINKAVKDEFKSNPFGYGGVPGVYYYYNDNEYLNASQFHVEENRNSFIHGRKLNKEFIDFLKKEYGIGKTYLSYGQNGPGIFIIEDNDFPVLNF